MEAARGYDGGDRRDAVPAGAARLPNRLLVALLTCCCCCCWGQWLADNGAAFPKLEWPARVGARGLQRGVRASAAIAPREELLRVPARLLISERRCWADAQLGRVFRENRDVFSRDDPVLALFLVRELAMGDASFFQPYLAILPEPESVQDWADAELDELRDRCARR